MSDQKKEPSLEKFYPDNPSLEERFGEPKDPRVFENEIGVENSAESLSEKTPEFNKIREEVRDQKDVDHAHVMQDASELHQINDRDSQIQKLIDLAMNDGVVHAVAVAEKAGDFYMLDQLHDKLLSEELHEQLVARDLI
jgi:hypothetical protein